MLPAGTRLGPVELGLAASLGVAQLPVRRRLRVAVLSTGDELVEPGTVKLFLTDGFGVNFEFMLQNLDSERIKR